jgi:hypothetical protein
MRGIAVVRPHVTVVAMIVVAMSVLLVAQRPVSAQSSAEKMRRWDAISVMETALERGVTSGAGNVSKQLRDLAGDVGVFDSILSGSPSASGVPLSNYGVFFNVRVPGMDGTLVLFAQSMVLRQKVIATNAGARAPAPVPPPVSPFDAQILTDPNAVYRTAVTDALIDTMLTYSGTLGLRENESLTVAARRDSPVNPLDPNDRVRTVILTVKGSVIDALTQKKIDLAEAKKQVVVEEE